MTDPRKFFQLAIIAVVAWMAVFSSPTAVAQAQLVAPPPQEEIAVPPNNSEARAISRAHALRSIDMLTTRSLALGAMVDRAANHGPKWLSAPVLLGVSAARYLASALLVLLVALFTWQLMRVIRRFAGHIEQLKEQTWPRMLLSAVRKPVAMAIWIYTAFFAITQVAYAMDTRPATARFFSGLTYVGLTVASFWLLMRLIRGAQHKLQRRADRTESVLDNVLVPVVGTALRLLVPLVTAFILLGAIDLPENWEWVGTKLLAMMLIGSVAFLIIRAASVAEKALLRLNRLDVADNLRARQIYTQVSVVRKLIVAGAIFLAVACILMLFQPVRQLGTSILASAGIAGVVLGFAAQKTLGNVFAGIQIAISQPIRIDDVVIVEGEWGRIEDITLTFVTVRIWDLRRLVLPINYFIEKPFQNWTRKSANLLNAVYIYADYTLPVETLRIEFKRLLDETPLWDQQTWVLQITDSTPQSMEIRALMSTKDASTGWDLKCFVREGLVRFIQKEFPDSLPRIRTELHRDVASHVHPAPAPVPEASSSPGIEEEAG